MQFNRKKQDRINKDYNFYHNLLKRKIKELHIESKNIQLEISKIEKGNQEYYNLDKKLNTLSSEVRELEG